MIIVLGSATALPGRLPELLALSQAHVQRSRAEPGCISHAVHVDADNDHRLVFVEHWQDLPALQAHFQVPASRQFARDVSALSAAPPTLSVFDAQAVDPRTGQPAGQTTPGA